ncbi:SDR family NAD(P)-dependent oxidoreductase [Amycolatopsis tolypomycina]|uniref:SDR family NAD(P)-dependent oxidoreductase n=1 Tax=Amycolatopsis tolypomycina TaxID=208445 RepID=UPI0033A31A8F
MISKGPIAVVGLSCRVPGAADPGAFWRLLRDGTEAITDVPAGRWEAGADPAGRGGFLDDVRGFDPGFFGISPRAAAALDPQQRLALELGWEALEDAGVVPARLSGSDTGVFLATGGDDYALLTHQAGRSAITSHTFAGLHRGLAANRVSHFLGLHGPSLTVDTAQSSSLVAVHLACESLRRGETAVALAGGVHLNLVPDGAVAFAEFGGLSPDGRCYAFDARANGTVRGEGGAVVVLKRLADAEADGDRVYALVHGGAMNHGGASEALTVPDEAAQRAVLRAAYARAGVRPEDVGYVELHGTGTRRGDPVEAAALGSVLGAARTGDRPLLVGSVKTNIGHLDAAAGVAGLVKTVLALHHGEVPASLNHVAPPPEIPLAELNLAVNGRHTPWPDSGRFAGVSSFGMGGTNCHLVLSRPAPDGGSPVAAPPVLAWTVSARTRDAVRGQAGRLAEFVAAEPGRTPAEIAGALAAGRTAFPERAVVVGTGDGELRAGLAALAAGTDAGNVLRGTATGGTTAFLFAGQGSQRPGMGRELYSAFPVYAAAFDEVCAAFDPLLGTSLKDVVFAGGALLDETRFTQPAVFAVEVALVRLLAHWGLRPDLLAGHSAGELVAAHVAGVLSLPDAATLVAERARLMQTVADGGAMAAIEAGEDEVLGEGVEAGACVSAVNGPRATVVSGSEEAVLAVAARWRERGRRVKRLLVGVAGHSALLDPILGEFARTAGRLAYGEPAIPVVTNLTGRLAADRELREPGYWVRQVREPVRFGDALRTLHELGATRFVEVSPDRVLAALVRGALPDAAVSVTTVLRAGRPEPRTLVSGVAQAFADGAPVDWPAVFGDPAPARAIGLPGYAFQRKPYWLGTTLSTMDERPDVPADGGDPLDVVRSATAVVLGYPGAGDVDPRRTFRDLGFDSLAAVELRDRLTAATGVELPPTLTFNHPTPLALAEHLRGERRAPAAPVAVAEPGEPIAIVGMGCRFPGGAGSPEDLWRLVADGVDAITGFPGDRGWDLGAAGAEIPRRGGFLPDAALFDPEFFGISPREALAMDPQQRLLLETAWEALERAGLDPAALRGTPAGVFVGATASDYGPRLHEAGHGAEGHVLTGSSASLLSGRVAYTLGFEGPAVTVDTACSSSLVALHLAARALRQGECTLALAGGVTVLATPGIFLEFGRQGGLAADGRCKAFGAGADGTAWAEGAGLVLLERLSDARRHGHPVLALVAGSAINSDGASNGLTAPSGPAQERVIRAALAGARLSTSDVDVVEAHGTGTALGDPIEAGALLATYGRDRETPLWLGSLKSNIGHAQAAAGIGGVVKMVQAMHHGVLPATLHAEEPSPHVDWSAGRVRLLTSAREWPEAGRPRRAAVSSFGISGTNAHVVLEQAPAEPETPAGPAPESPLPYVLSARDTTALRAQARRLRDHLTDHPDEAPADIAYSLATTRTRFDLRAAFVATGRSGLLDALDAIASDGTDIVRATTGGTVFVFPGQGSQWAGMAAGLLGTSPVFAARFAECERALAEHLDWSPADVLRERPEAPALDRDDVVQPVLFAVMVSLAALWRAHGVEPDAVIGHSQGEIAAACVAGALSLADAARVVALRARLLGELAGLSGMVSVPLPEAEVTELLTGWGDRVSVAAVNGPRSVAVSGDPDALRELVAACALRDVRARKIPIDYASHSRHVERLRDRLLAALAPITPRPPDIPFFSTVTGEPHAVLDAAYWYRNLREPVRFEAGVRRLLAAGHRVFAEVGPHPVLALGMRETFDDAGVAAAAVGTLRRGDGGRDRFLRSLAEAHACGAAVRWDAVFAGTGARRTGLPTYPFRRRRFWWRPPAEARTGTDPAAGLRYGIAWWPATAEGTARLSGTWLVAGGRRSPWRPLIAAALAEAGADVRDEDFTGEPAGVVSLHALDEEDALTGTLSLLRRFGCPMWSVTCGAVGTGDGDPVRAPRQAAVWGLGQVAALEQPHRWGGLADLPEQPAAEAARRLAGLLTGTEDQVAVRPSGVFARRLVRPAPSARPAWRPRGTVLVTGGTGALGRRVARWLAANGAAHVVLAGRSGPAAPEAAAITEELGADRVTVAACDVTDESAVAALVASVPGELTAVVHAAGTNRFGRLADIGPAHLAEVLGAKVRGAEVLDRVLGDRPLDAFVLFSSAAGVWGGAEQGAYSAANACLDALAHRRRALGRVATAVAWGPWSGGGMVTREFETALRARGFTPIDPGVALDALATAVGGGETATVVADVDWPRFAALYTMARPSPLLGELAETRRPAEPRQSASALGQRLRELPEAGQHDLLRTLVRTQLAAVLGHDGPAAVAADRPFSALGLDSLTAVELRDRLAAATELALPVTIVFDHPTATALATHLRDTALGTHVAEAAAPAAPADEPLAIVGMSCRLPGGIEDPEDLWRLLAEGGDAVGGLPADRGWDLGALYDPDPDRPGTSYVRGGGYLSGIDRFDADLFGIAPREALVMDPQQRLLLEATWTALEHAGIAPGSLSGSGTAVFAGIQVPDYWTPDRIPGALEAYQVTAGAPSVAAGRIAYTFGLEGPAMTVDTACSSSLVALHLAARSLRAGECSLAIVGGATVMTTPAALRSLSRQRALSPDGRCKAFSAGADGFGAAEGVAALVVERLSDARRNGHRVLAVLRGSAVNSDGASNGLTAPNGLAQQRVIRAALADAGLSAADVDAVEAHGTGTRLGDPVEALALQETYGRDRPADRPVLVGSVKSNLGHTQAVSGLAGVIKTVLALRNGELPRTLHADRPSSHVDWTRGALTLLTEPAPWPATGRPRRAGVSSFGISGTNAHVVLEQAPADPEPADGGPAGVVPWVLTGATPEAVHDLADRVRSSVAGRPELTVRDVARTLAARSAHAHRAVVVGEGREELLAALAGVRPERGTGGKLAFLFTGQGSQYAGMGGGLRAQFPVYAEAFDAACAAAGLDPAVVADGDALARTEFAQPALFALQVALYRLAESWGLRPDVLIGHSVGEIAAAHVAGVLSLADAGTLVAARGRLMQDLPAVGAMIAVEASEAEVRAALTGEAAIAAVNGPAAVVLSGAAAAVEAVAAEFAARGRRTKRLPGGHAFHSPLMAPMVERFREVLAGLDFAEPAIPLRPAAAGDPATAEYWAGHVLGTVRFADAVAGLGADGVTTCLEIGPDGVLSALGPAIDPAIDFVPAQRADRPGARTAVEAAGRLHVLGHDVALASLCPGGRLADLPAYPFRHRSFWLAPGQAPDRSGHPLAGTAVRLADGGGALVTGTLSATAPGWLGDHTIGGTTLVPGTALLELALQAAAAAGCATVGELTLETPLVLPDHGSVQVQVRAGAADDGGHRPLTVHSGRNGEWTRHATGLAGPGAPADSGRPLPADAEPLAVERLYEQLADAGYGYGPAFRGLTAAWRHGEDVYAEAVLPEELRDDARNCTLHPALLDCALHALGFTGRLDGGTPVPFAWRGVSVTAPGPTAIRVRLTPAAGDAVSLHVTDPEGRPVATVDSLVLRPAAPAPRDGLLEPDWVRVPAPEVTAPEITAPEVTGPDVVPVGDLADLTGEPVPAAVVVPAGDPARALALCQAWVADDRFAAARLVLRTRNAVTDPDQAAVWGLVRSAQTEHPGRFVLLDAGPEDTAGLAAAIATGEPEVAVRAGEVLVPRLKRASTGDDLTLPDEPWRLAVVHKGRLDGLAPIAHPAEPPGPGQVRVAVRAAGLNFRDVLNTLGLYPGEAPPLGIEGAGVVTETGPGVTGFAPGDRVLGLLDHAFGPLAVTDRRNLVRVPPDWTFAEAAAVPVVFLTAWYGLRDLAGLRAGEKVLVHAGAGGVGMAAIQLARHLGADVHATASPAKHDVLRGLGLPDTHIASSRTLDFATAFAGTGFDVVLNSLAGEFVDASLGLLGDGGRFVELGKTDVRPAAEIPAGVTYRTFDLTEPGAERIQEMLRAVVDLFAAGALRPLPLSTWDIRRAVEAFRFVSQAKHVGKVVLTVPAGPAPEGTVLVTGGTGALGSLVARHLAGQGARHLLLAGRRGPAAPGVRELTAELAGLGASVTVAACDVADRGRLAALLAGIPAEHPLTAVVHAAGVLDDGLVAAMTPERLERVLRPKVAAAQHLDELTRGGDLAEFVLFSSASAFFGGAGQCNYTAANAALDALAARRRAAGLPAVSIAWGAWAHEGGMTGQLGAADHARLARAGLAALADERGLALFDAARRLGRPLVVAAELDIAALRRGGENVPPSLRGLAGATARRPEPGRARPEDVLDLVRDRVAAVLGHAGAAEVAPDRAFKDLGFDSLSSVELRNVLAAATGLRLPATVVFDQPTPEALAAYLRAELSGAAAAPVATVVTEAGDDPVAIVAMSCRLPGGVRSPEDLWRLVRDGADAVTGPPANRGWDLDALYDPDPERPGTTYARAGGFLHDADEFDPEFFGISPREALAMDPQQRLLLETAWEVFEAAGVDPGSVRGQRLGVFVGGASLGYGTDSREFPGELEGYRLTGSTTSVLSGRIAYTFGLEGPALTVDTACSSSLVALHLAVQAIRRGECSMALSGGAAIMANTDLFVELSRQRGLAPDGRCKPFAAAADGTAWGEGVGMLLLERLSDARRRGHEVLAVIRGSAVNSDGASNGLTAPNGPSQQRVIRAALADAGLSPSDVDAVEAHGTGTRLGDPIEAQALLATYGRDRTADHPLWLGSLKSNIGHAQSAAGVAAVIKMVLALRHGELPRTINLDEPTPHVDWSPGTVRLLTEHRAWPETSRAPRAAVSSFGISGTNAHLILEQAPPTPPAEPAVPAAVPMPLVLSARSEAALRARAGQIATVLAAEDLADVAHSLAALPRFEHRAVVVAAEALPALAEGRRDPAVVRGTAGTPGRTVFVFPGQGGQWAGMGVELLDSSPVFARRMRECDAALAEFTGWSVLDVLRGAPGAPSLDDVEVVQPALFAVMVSLAELWAAAGVRPDAVVGHSQGEIAAACVAGALSLADAARVIAMRSAISRVLIGRGSMAPVALGEEAAAELVAGWGDRLSIAAVNGPNSVAVAGDLGALHELVARCEAEGVRARLIPAAFASHSPAVEPLRAELLAAFAPVRPRTGEVAFYSTVTGGVLDGNELDAGYWYRNLRQPVRFDRAVRALAEQKHTTFVEIGPHPVLPAAIRELLDEPGASAPVVTGTLRRGEGGLTRFVASAAELHVRGVGVDWAGLRPGGRRIPLPAYPFQRQRFWLRSGTATADVSSAGVNPLGHPLLGAVVAVPGSEAVVFTGRIAASAPAWLGEHALRETTLLPGTAVLELAFRAGEHLGCDRVEDLVLAAPVVLPGRGGLQLRLVADEPDATGRHPFRVFTRPEGADTAWTQHAEGTLTAAGDVPAPRTGPWPPDGAEPLDLDGLHDVLADAGVHYGPAFRGAVRAWRHGDDVLAEVRLPEREAADAGRYGVHPALLDAALQPIGPGGLVSGPDLMPFAWSGVSLHAAGAAAARVRLHRTGADALAVELTDPAGSPVLSAESLTLRPVPAGPPGQVALFRLGWVPLPVLSGPQEGALRICDDPAEALEWVRTAGPGPVVVATRAAVAVSDAELPDPARATVWSAIRGLADKRIVLADLDDSPDAENLAKAAAALGEPELAVRGGAVHVPRLERVQPSTAEPQPFTGTVVVVGEEIEAPGAAAGVVAGSGAAAGGPADAAGGAGSGEAAAGAAGAAGSGAAAGGPADAAGGAGSGEAAAGAAGSGAAAGGPADAAGGAGSGEAAAAAAASGERAVGRAAADPGSPGWLRIASLADLPPLPSSGELILITGPADSPLAEALAAHRRALGHPTRTLTWGLPEAPPPERAPGDLVEAVRRVAVTGLVAAVLPASPSGAVPAVLRKLVRPAKRTAADRTWAQRLGALPAEDRPAAVLGVVREQIAAVLGLANPAHVRADRGLLQLGFDSLTAVELRTRLGELTGLRLPATLVFDHPTAADIAGHLTTLLVPDAGRPPADTEERDFRAALAALGYARLKEAGLVRTVLDLAAAPADDDRIDAMDVADLVRLALGDPADAPDER